MREIKEEILNKITSEFEMLLDEFFPKLNSKNPKYPSSNNRSSALVFYAHIVNRLPELLDIYAKEVIKECLPEGGEFSGSDGWKEYEKYVIQNAKEFNIKLD